MSARKKWFHQWHITADGTIIKHTWHGGGAAPELYRRFSSSTPLDVDGLVALDHAIEKMATFWDRIARLLLIGYVLCAAGLIAGLVLIWTGNGGGASTALLVICGIAFLVLIGIGGIVASRLRKGAPRIYAEAGITEPAGTEMTADAAEAAIAADGTHSSEATGPRG